MVDFYQKAADGLVLGYSTAPEIPYETIPTNTSPQRRLIERVRTLYRKDSEASTTDPAPLPLGQIDSAGVATNGSFDFKGNLVSSTRQLVQDYKTIPDWSSNPVLETEVLSSSTRYDALNRPIQLVAPHGNQPSTKLNVIRPG